MFIEAQPKYNLVADTMVRRALMTIINAKIDSSKCKSVLPDMEYQARISTISEIKEDLENFFNVLAEGFSETPSSSIEDHLEECGILQKAFDNGVALEKPEVSPMKDLVSSVQSDLMEVPTFLEACRDYPVSEAYWKGVHSAYDSVLSRILRIAPEAFCLEEISMEVLTPEQILPEESITELAPKESTPEYVSGDIPIEAEIHFKGKQIDGFLIYNQETFHLERSLPDIETKEMVGSLGKRVTYELTESLTNVPYGCSWELFKLMSFEEVRNFKKISIIIE